MSCWPQNATGLNYITYPVGPTASGTGVAASASTNTKGSYVQFIASSPFACQAVVVTCPGNTTASPAISALIDVATGAAASEVVVIPNLPYSDLYGAGTAGAIGFPVPLAIANGTRIAMRAQSATSSGSPACAITLVDTGGMLGASTFTLDGAATGTSRITTIDAGGTANTKGSYTQISGSTATVAQWIEAMFIRGGQGTNSGGAVWAIDIATGGSGSEVVLIPDLRAVVGPNATTGPLGMICPQTYPMLTYIAASTRLAMRASCSTNTATLRTFDTALLYAAAPSEPSGTSGGAWAFA